MNSPTAHEISPVDIAIDAAGSLTALAQLMGQSSNTISNWRKRGRVPLDQCAPLEKAVGGAVMRWHMRPSDWHVQWPELLDRHDAPAVEASHE